MGYDIELRRSFTICRDSNPSYLLKSQMLYHCTISCYSRLGYWKPIHEKKKGLQTAGKTLVLKKMVAIPLSLPLYTTHTTNVAYF